jgi:hypothetical protein
MITFRKKRKRITNHWTIEYEDECGGGDSQEGFDAGEHFFTISL